MRIRAAVLDQPRRPLSIEEVELAPRFVLRLGDAAADLPRPAELALSGELDLAGVVTSVEPLEAVNDALDRLKLGEGARPVLIVDETLTGYEETA